MILILLVLLIALVGASVILLAQNWSPVLPLIIFGQTTVELPLALWILGAVLAGIVTSVVLQGLNYLAGRLTSSSRQHRSTAGSHPPIPPRSPRSSRRPGREPLTEPARKPAPKQTISEWELEDDAWGEGEETEVNPEPETPQTPEEEEWAAKKQEEDWDLEKPPREPTIPALKRKIEQSINLESLRDQSTEQRSQRVEEYQRKKQQQQGRQDKQQIYDAQYRVIKPPQASPPPIAPDDEENEEEDWI